VEASARSSLPWMRVAGHFFQTDPQKRCSAWRTLIAHDEDVVEHGVVNVKFGRRVQELTRDQSPRVFPSGQSASRAGSALLAINVSLQPRGITIAPAVGCEGTLARFRWTRFVRVRTH
jgi:hypothetical protein